MMILRGAPELATGGLFPTVFFESQEFGDSVFAVIATDLTEFVKDVRLILFGGLLIARGNAKKVMSFGFGTHKAP